MTRKGEMRMRRFAIAVVVGLVAAGCGSSGDSSPATDAPVQTESPAETDAPTETEAPVTTDAPPETDAPVETEAAGPNDDGVLEVPAEYDTIQSAVDAAGSGDLVLISPGVYNEAVNVVTDGVVIRGLEREGVVLDGEFELDNGIRVLGAKGVVVENLTAQNYTNNGVFFTGAEGYRVSYVTAYRNGDYGIYGFDAVKGVIEHSYGAGSPDAGFYIGQCYPCDSLLDDVLAEHNGLGYSGTNSGGNLLIVNSTFRNNRAGIVPNSGSYELCYPERETTIVGNIVHSNNQPDTPAIDVALLAMGNGILAPGGIRNRIERNLVFDHDRTGIGLVPFLEEGPNDDLTTPDEWEVPCEIARDEPLAEEIPDVLLWDAQDNVVRGNVVSDSRTADLGQAGVGIPTADLGNCWEGNTFETSAPAGLEALAPCTGEGSGDWEANPLDVFAWLSEVATRPPPVDYQIAELPPIPDLEDMPDAATAPAEPAIDLSFSVDVDAITVPAKPTGAG